MAQVIAITAIGGAVLLIGLMSVFAGILAACDAWRWRSASMAGSAAGLLACGFVLIGLIALIVAESVSA